MKFSCEKALLQSAIATASRGAAPKSSIPALEGILLEADTLLKLTGYNLETGIRCSLPAQVEEGGSLVLSARLFGDIIRRLPDDVVYVSTQELTVHIRCGVAKFQIQGIDATEFPELPEVESQNALVLPRNTLGDMISRTIFAISNNDGRPILTGSLFEVIGDMLTVVSVDGQRLALRREKLAQAPGPDFSFVVPGAALGEIRTICGDSDEPVTIHTGERHILFQIGSTLLVTRRLEGEFIDYRRSISWKSDIVLEGEVKALMTSIDRVSLILQENVRNPLRCIVGDGCIYLSSVTAVGSASDECPVVGDGRDLHIGFNHRFMMDALKATPTEHARLLLGTPSTPCIIVPTDEEEGQESFLFMILPVRMGASWDR